MPLRPPSVGGWPAGAAWLTTSSLQVRLRLAAAAGRGGRGRSCDRLGTRRRRRKLDALARLLVVDAWTDRTQAALDPGRRQRPQRCSRSAWSAPSTRSAEEERTVDTVDPAQVPHHQRRGRRRRARRRRRRVHAARHPRPPRTTRRAGPATGPWSLVTLYGGNDGLATVIPYADPAYHDARPELAYTADEVLKLDDTTGLNPALSRASSSCTTPSSWPSSAASATRSRTAATSGRWTSGRPRNPDRPGNTGWLGRWLDTVGGDPRLAVSFEPVLPPLLAGATSAGASVPGHGRQACPTASSAAVLTALGQPSGRRTGAAGPGRRAASPTCSRSTP